MLLAHSPLREHAVPDANFVQAPAPLQLVAPVHSLEGSVPLAMLPHTPFGPPPFKAAEVAWHTPLQAVSEQKPSTQLNVEHWFPATHAEPCVFLATQAPDEQ
jgi:hypothetical protein